MNREIQKDEAIKRMTKIGLIKPCINAFKENNSVWVSETAGLLFDLSQRPKWREKIKELEKKYKICVYHIIYTHNIQQLTFFYVSNEKDEWVLDNNDLLYNHSCCYVYNLLDPEMSEFGGIGFKKLNGGLVRIY